MNSPGSVEGGLVSALGERALIERIHARLPPAPPGLIVGIGDDAAVAQPERGALLVLTTDALVEGVHFDLRFSTPNDVGHKALAVNISDIASMGGSPRYALLSLILPDSTTVETVDGLIDGLTEVARASGVALAGGNISRSPGPLVVDVSLAGSVKPRKVLQRNGGRPGDGLYVTGSIGGAAAGLGWLRQAIGDGDGAVGQTGGPVALPGDEALAECVMRHRRPDARARLGSLLGRNRAASACMDLSDGLADAIAQITAASGTGARIDAAALPVHPGARAWFASQGTEPELAAISGGDDYELLFSVPKRRQGRLRGVVREGRGVPVTRIGELTAAKDVVLVRGGIPEPLPRGFTHF